MKPSHASLYEIRVEGELPSQWRDWFGGLEIAAELAKPGSPAR